MAKSWLSDCTGDGGKLKKLQCVERKQHVLAWNGETRLLENPQP